MGLVSKTAKVKWNGKNKKYYESLGYTYTKMRDEFEINVKDLSRQSNASVNCECDGCGKKLTLVYSNYINNARKDGKTYCQVCGINFSRSGEAFFKSFYDWCIEHHRQDVLDRWDYELNNCTPKDITYSTNKKCYFKCDKHHNHNSELKRINDFTSGNEGAILCKQCNSIAQYILDNFPNKDLYDVWDKEKNGDVNPWEISKGNKSKKYWFICQEKDYHKSYEMVCGGFSRGSRCPYCSSKMIHPKDSLGQYIIDSYSEDFLHKIWSDRNKISPFDLSINSAKKVWFKCQEGEHEDYLRTCNDSSKLEFRCPKCVEEKNASIIEEKTKLYLKELGYEVLTEHNCTIRPINPKTKMPMPYDNEIKELKLIIEVHGEQHYGDNYYKAINKCSDEEAAKMLKQRKLYDRYKKAYAEHHNYNYLEIPYTAFDKKETYKQMIDNKIEEILHNTKAS